MSPLTELRMDTPGQRTMFLILAEDGRVRGAGRSAGTLYASLSAAMRRAQCDGDSVIAVTIDLRSEPAFIRRKKLLAEPRR